MSAPATIQPAMPASGPGGHAPAVIRLVDVYKSFGNVRVFAGLNVSVRPRAEPTA